MNYIYISVYEWYYKMKTQGRKVDPTGMTAIMLGLCFSGWMFLLDWMYYHFALHRFPGLIHKLILIMSVFLFAWLIDEIYTSNNRYLKIYDKYIISGRIRNKRKSFLLSFLFILLPYVFLITFAVCSTTK